MAGGNLSKRIKKHVKGKSHLLAGICNPSWDDLALKELEYMGFEPRRESPGLLLFRVAIEDVYKVHLQSRLCSSFRLRLKEFRCGAREDLFATLRGFPWEHWFSPNIPFIVKTSFRASRIRHEGRAIHSAWKAVKGRLDEYFGDRGEDFGQQSEHFVGPDGKIENSRWRHQKIYLRIEGTRAQLSLDASGELLHRRGFLPKQGKAPLRETLAAAICSAAPFALREPLVDGMAGSGCFLAEATMISRSLWPIPVRKFAFEHWPVYNSVSLDYFRRKLEAENEARDSHISLPSHAVEIDPDIVPLLKANMNLFGKSRKNLSEIIVHQEDLFTWIYELIGRNLGGQADPVVAHQGHPAGTLLFNPPYDWRIGRREGTYKRIWNLFVNLLPQWQGIVLLPLKQGLPDVGSIDMLPNELKSRCKRRDFPHGGRWVQAVFIFSQNTVTL